MSQTGLSSGSEQFAVFVAAMVGCGLAANAIGAFVMSVSPSVAPAFIIGSSIVLLFNLLIGVSIVRHCTGHCECLQQRDSQSHVCHLNFAASTVDPDWMEMVALLQSTGIYSWW